MGLSRSFGRMASIISLSGLLPAGAIAVPPESPNPLGIVWYSNGIKVFPLVSPYDIKDFSRHNDSTRYFVSYAMGNDANSGLTNLLPFKTVDRFKAVAAAGSTLEFLDDKIGINCWGVVGLSANGNYKFIGKPTKTIISSFSDVAVRTYAKVGASNYYYEDNSAFVQDCPTIYDAKIRDVDGSPMVYRNVADITATTLGGVFQYVAGTPNKMRIRTFDGRAPDADIIHVAPGISPIFNQASNTGQFVFENIDFIYNSAIANGAIQTSWGAAGAPNNSAQLFRNCGFYGGSGCGAQLNDAEITVLENCRSNAVINDNFNYHWRNAGATRGQFGTVYEIDCVGRNAGFTGFKGQINTNGTSCQVSSCHDGATIWRANTIARTVFSTPFADVNGVCSNNMNLSSRVGLVGDAINIMPKANFVHDNDPPYGTQPYMWLWQCAGYCEDSAGYLLAAINGGKIRVNSWRGQLSDKYLYGDIRNGDNVAI